MRGQAFHNYIVDCVARKLQALGWEVQKEYPLEMSDGRTDYADIYACKNGRVLLAEIESTVRNLSINIDKAATLNLPLIVILPNRKTLKAAVQKYKRRKKPPRSPPVIFLLLSQITGQKRIYFPEKGAFSLGE